MVDRIWDTFLRVSAWEPPWRCCLLQSLEEAREYIAGKAEEGRDFVRAKSEDLRRQAEGAVEKGKDLVTKQKDLLSAALEAGKQAYAEEKTKSR